jgi:hypothetical protein
VLATCTKLSTVMYYITNNAIEQPLPGNEDTVVPAKIQRPVLIYFPALHWNYCVRGRWPAILTRLRLLSEQITAIIEDTYL